MDFETKVAQETLEKLWPNHPKEINSEIMINISKQMILIQYPNITISKKNLSIAELYKKIGDKFITTSGKINPAKEIKNKTNFGKNWLQVIYETTVQIIKKPYK